MEFLTEVLIWKFLSGEAVLITSERNKAIRKRSLSCSYQRPWVLAFGRSGLGAAFCFVQLSYNK
ncbi:hypothetical protein HMPREF9104_02663 [Lentilactobacillus kisonensis F0435]|uniref:Uncharacterized protein n=1 Tax=Lentilactobacillus kisonensis F0435 TaxID=797516 RepID=H1LJ71_9LACO|nr:hypothetical protein HMPREF9104_02663 [Lentilactobacillus kisonensis F0435]